MLMPSQFLWYINKKLKKPIFTFLSLTVLGYSEFHHCIIIYKYKKIFKDFKSLFKLKKVLS